MTYCKRVNENGELECLLTYDFDFTQSADPLEIIITQEEYEQILSEIVPEEPEEPDEPVMSETDKALEEMGVVLYE